jgi:hypothetical protein
LTIVKADERLLSSGRVSAHVVIYYTPVFHKTSAEWWKRWHPKDMLMDEQRRLSRQYKQIEEEQEDSLVSWDQMKENEKLMDLRIRIGSYRVQRIRVGGESQQLHNGVKDGQVS